MALGAFVNADDIARGLAGFDTESVDRQAGRLMLERLRELAAHRADFAFETTLASRSFAPFLKQLIAGGYRVRLVYVWLNSPDLCVSRVAARHRSGGHTVAEDIIRRRYLRSVNNFFTLFRQLADRWEVFDNTAGTGAQLIAEGRRSIVTAIHDQDVWNSFTRSAGHEREP